MKSKKNGKNNMPLHLMLLPGVILTAIFCYIPMGGLVIAFQKFIPAKGLFGNQKWIGLENFKSIFEIPDIWTIISNTFVISTMKIILGIAIPVLVALLLNEVRLQGYKRGIQTLIYFPYFISWVVMAGILIDILSPSNGMIAELLRRFNVEAPFFLGDNNWFQFTLVASDTWKNFGFGTIVYLAAMTGINPSLYEAAKVDGANRFKQILHITLPGIKYIVVLMMVLSVGNVLNAGFDQVWNLLNPAVLESGEILDTMIYRMGLLNGAYGPATALGLMKSMVSMVLIGTSYWVAHKFFDYKVF